MFLMLPLRRPTHSSFFFFFLQIVRKLYNTKTKKRKQTVNTPHKQSDLINLKKNTKPDEQKQEHNAEWCFMQPLQKEPETGNVWIWVCQFLLHITRVMEICNVKFYILTADSELLFCILQRVYCVWRWGHVWSSEFDVLRSVWESIWGQFGVSETSSCGCRTRGREKIPMRHDKLTFQGPTGSECA